MEKTFRGLELVETLVWKKRFMKSLQEFWYEENGEDLWSPFWVDKRDKGNTDWKTICLSFPKYMFIEILIHNIWGFDAGFCNCLDSIEFWNQTIIDKLTVGTVCWRVKKKYKEK